MKPQKDIGMHTRYDIVESNVVDTTGKEFKDSFNTFSTEVGAVSTSSIPKMPVINQNDWMSPSVIESNLTWEPTLESKKSETIDEKSPYTFAAVMSGGFLATTVFIMHLFTRD